jgi:ABC-type lipoprotein export system ATPase subunit
MSLHITFFFLLGLSYCNSLRISVRDLSKQFPTNVWRRLTSSVPVRDYAVKSVSLEADSELILLVGASSSGKSTILKCILEGSSSIELSDSNVQPIYLDRKPHNFRQSNYQAIGDILNKDDTVKYWSEVLHLDLSLRCSDLSPSQEYQYALVQACCASSMTTPLLLLDEWMDQETSLVVQRVEQSILRLTEQGAVVFCVTHKPDLFAKLHRRITICRGEVLSDTSNKKEV